MLGSKEPEAITLISLILAPFDSGQRYRILDYMMKRYTDDFGGELEELKTTHVGQYYNEGCEPSDDSQKFNLPFRPAGIDCVAEIVDETPSSMEVPWTPSDGGPDDVPAAAEP